MSPTENRALDQFLSEQASVCEPRHLPEGVCLGTWQVRELLGRGGSAEVYRVVNRVTTQVAAAKILTKSDAPSRRRFEEEIRFLSANSLPRFPRLYASGVHEGSPFLIQELLMSVEVHDDDRSVAEYLIAVSEGVMALHRAGFVHRDLKPKNIMRRVTGEIVLIDFGLAKDVFSAPLPRKEISIVSEKVVAVGTPGYAAPEQLLGGEASMAADIHALGRIANAAFDGHPPRCWETIIRGATSSIPEQRYLTVGEFVAAIRRRHRRERVNGCLVMAGVVLALAAGFFLYWRNGGAEAYAWHMLQKSVAVPVVEQQVLSETWVTNALGRAICTERVTRSETNVVELTQICLNGSTNVFTRPLALNGGRVYRIVGPGVLDASIIAAESNVTLRLKDCVLRNRTTVPLFETGLRYVFEGGVLLDFPQLDRIPLNAHEALIDYDAAFNRVHFRNDHELD